MLSVNLLGRKGAEEYCRYVEEWCGLDAKAILYFNKDEASDFLEMGDADKYVLIRFNGAFEHFNEEMNLIKPLGKIPKIIIAIKGDSYLTINDVTKIRNEAMNWFDCSLDNHLMGFSDGLDIDEVEVQMLVKTYVGVNLWNKSAFSSLWTRVLADAELESDLSFYLAVKDLVPVEIMNNVITLKIPDMTRVRFIMSVKREKLEHLIREYTCKNYTLKII